MASSAPDSGSRDHETVLDILRAAALAQQFVTGLDRDSFLDDLKTQAAVLHEIAIIGEATKRLSDALRIAHPEIPWRMIAGMRDRLIHHYDEVDLEQVWRTVTIDIPILITQLEKLASPGQT